MNKRTRPLADHSGKDLGRHWWYLSSTRASSSYSLHAKTSRKIIRSRGRVYAGSKASAKNR